MSDSFSRTPACLCLALALAACASPQPEVADANATSAPPAFWWSVFDWNTNEGFRTSSPDGTVTMVGKHNVDVALEVFAWSGAGDVQVTGQLRQIQCGHIEYVSPLKGGGASRVVSGGRTYDAQLPPRDESNPIPLVQMAVSAYHFNPASTSAVQLCPATVGQYQGTTVSGTIQLNASATAFQNPNVKTTGTLTINLVPCDTGRTCQ